MSTLHDKIRELTHDAYWIGNPTLEANTDWHMIDGLNVLVTRPMEGDSAVVPAPVTICGVISSEKYRLLADGLWNARYVDETPMHRVKATAFLEAAFIESITQIWAQQLGGLVKIQNSKATTGAKLSNVIVHQSSVKIRHALFKKIEVVGTVEVNETTVTRTLDTIVDLGTPPLTAADAGTEPTADAPIRLVQLPIEEEGAHSAVVEDPLSQDTVVTRRASRRSRASRSARDNGVTEPPAPSVQPVNEDMPTSSSTTASESGEALVNAIPPIDLVTEDTQDIDLEESRDDRENAAVAVVSMVIEDPDDPFSLRNWPSSSPEGRLALEAMLEEGIYEPVPIPAFDVNDRVVKPNRYEAELKGAVVCVTVTMVHQYLRSIKTNNFFADIQEIKILQRPLPVVVTPSKRKLQAQLDELRATRKARG